MPKNQYFIKENYKKVEEVREAESHVLSCEEFINKKSQLSSVARKKIVNKSGSNYLSLLVDKDISEIKGYGPCVVCRGDTHWIDLKIVCPAAGCDSREPIYFTHLLGCGSRLQLSNKAQIRCSGCSFNCNLKDYYFDCSRHRGNYRKMDEESWNKSMSFMLMGGNVGWFVRDLNVYMVNHGW